MSYTYSVIIPSKNCGEVDGISAKREQFSFANNSAFFVIVLVCCLLTWMLATGRLAMPSQVQDIIDSLAPTSATRADEWQLTIVSRERPIDSEYEVRLKTSPLGWRVDDRIYESLNLMLADAEAQGIGLVVISGYRSYSSSQQLYSSKVQEFLSMGYGQAAALERAAQWVAPPGTSEHHTGLAVDIVSDDYYSYYSDLLWAFEQFPAYRWLYENCADYGFTLRYPRGKTDITGVEYEPWHFRYVGVENARYMMEQNLCLEEYLELLQQPSGADAPSK